MDCHNAVAYGKQLKIASIFSKEGQVGDAQPLQKFYHSWDGNVFWSEAEIVEILEREELGP